MRRLFGIFICFFVLHSSLLFASSNNSEIKKYKCKIKCEGMGLSVRATTEDFIWAKDNSEAERIAEEKYKSYCKQYPYYGDGASGCIANADCEEVD